MTQVFYSKSANLNVQVKAPRALMQDGNRVLVDEKMAQFRETGESFTDESGRRFSVGVFSTDDPEMIEKLSNHPLVMSPQEYNRVMTPPEVREKIAQEQTQRLISQNNELLKLVADLETQLQAKNAASAKK
jgi:ABC-type sugar transport system ATPase subunit